MNVKSSLVSLAALVSVFGHAADTARNIETINDGESVVTVVDHTRLVNGTTEVVANGNGTASIATADGVYGNPIFTIHAGSVFTGDTAAHSKTFTGDYVVDFSGVDLSGSSPPFVVQDGWRFIGPTDDNPSKTLWCGPTDYPAWEFSLSNYDSGSPTVTFVPAAGSEFTGTITVARTRGALIATVDNVLVGSTETANSSRKFTTSQASEYVFVNPGNNNPIFHISPGDVSLFSSSIGIGSSTVDSLGILYGVGKFQKNGYNYVFPYTGNSGSGSYTLATTSMLDGYVATNHVGNVDLHGTVRVSFGDGLTSSLAIGNASDSVYANSSCSLALGANSIVENCYGGMALGIFTHTTNQFAFVYGGDYMSGKYYGDHGGGTFNVNPFGGLAGFWIGETNLAAYLNQKANTTDIPTVPTNVSSFTNDANYIAALTATNIARAIIRDAVANVNVNIQSAEDTRVALTNLITILKNL